MTDATLFIKVDATEVDKGKKSLDGLAQSGEVAEKGVGKATTATTGLSNAAKAAAGVLASLGVAMGVREIIQYADEWQNASNRLRLVTADSKDLAAVQQILLRTANDTRAGFAGTAELFTVLSRSTKDLGLSQTDVIDLTKTLNQSFAVSGASAGAMDGAIRQLSQGLQSGALRGDEFNSVAEQAPGILDAVASSLKMGRGELREFAATGGITSAVLVKAIQDYADVIENDFSKAQRTFGQSMIVAKNNMLEFVGGSKVVTTATRSAGDAVVFLSDHLDDLAAVAGIAALAFSAKLVPSITISKAALAGYFVATESATVATNFLGQRTVTTTIQQSAFTASLVSAKAAAVALAGPLGIGLLLGAAYLLVQRQKEAAEEADKLSTRFDEMRSKLGALTQGEIARAIQAEFELTNKLKEKQKMYQSLFDTQGTYGAELDHINLQIMEAESNHGLLVRQLERTKKATDDNAASANTAEAYVRSLSHGFAVLSDEVLSAHEYLSLMVRTTDNASKATRDFARMMDAAAVAAGNSEAAYVDLMGVQVETYTRTTRLTAAQREGITANQDAADSIDDLIEGMGKQGEASEAMTQVMSLMRDDISSAFADMMMSGENAFDAIAKSFERMIYKMVADWAAAGVMNMVSKAFGGSGGYTSVLGDLLKGGAAKTAVSAVTGTGAAAGTAAAGGGILSGIGGAISGAGSAIAGGASAIGSGAMSAIAAVPGWGWALAGGAALASLISKDSTPSSNAGFLMKDVPGAKADQKFQVDPFASGFQPVGFARREDQAASMQVIDTFRKYDAALTEMAGAAGISVNMDWTKLGGVGASETGQGSGVFVGIAAEDGRTKSASLSTQVDEYVTAWINGLGGAIGPGARNAILSAGSADAMLAKAAELVAGMDGSHANGLNYVPFDNYRANLHKGEEVVSVTERKRRDSEMGAMISKFAGMEASLHEVAMATRRTADLLLRVTRDGESLVTVAA